MQFIAPGRTRIPPSDVESLLRRIDEEVAARTSEGSRAFVSPEHPWDDRDNQIEPLIQALRSGNKLLTWFIRESPDQNKIPRLQGAQSFLICSSEYFTARINLWFPETQGIGSPESYRKYLSVGELHNHDFSFLTINLLGSGYTSSFYRDADYNPNLVPGDRPALVEDKTILLNDSRVLLVEEYRDYHIQWWPRSFSVTLNIIPRMKTKEPYPQYVLDSDLRIKTIVSGGL